jgi:hypothetical protein
LKRKVTMLESKSQQQAFRQRADLHSLNTKKTPDKLIDRTLSCRHEIKYLISESKAHAIAQFIKPYVPLDKYSKLQRGGSYPIVSLYLDSNDLILCRETLTGRKNRFKLRIRSYADEPDYPCFFEIKRRINTIIVKSRARIMRKNVALLLSGRRLPPQDYHVDEKILEQFQLYMKNINARPTVLIRYLRQAYENDSENRVRLTFDRELCYKVTHLPEINLNGSSWQRNSLTMGEVILEIKFTGRYPAWLSRTVEYFDLQQRSVSKYTTSVQQSCLLRFCAPSLEESDYG